MANNNLNFTIQVDERGATQSMTALNTSILTLDTSITDLGTATTSSFTDIGNTLATTGGAVTTLATDVGTLATAQDDLADSSENSGESTGKLGKAFGGLDKVLGAAGIIGLFLALWEVMKENQKIMDIISTVTNALSAIFNSIASVVGDFITNVKGLNLNFESTIAVVKNVIKLAFTPLKLTFLGVKAGVLGLQLAWEQSFLGGGDEGKIEELTGKLSIVKDQVIELKDSTIEAAQGIKNNIGAAISEVTAGAKAIGAIAKESIKEFKNISISASLELGRALTEARNAVERLRIEQEGLSIQYEIQAEAIRQVRDSELQSIDARIAANNELGALLVKQAGEEKALAEARLGIAQLELSANRDSIELQNAVLEAKNEVADVEAKIIGLQSEQLGAEESLNIERSEGVKEALEKKIEAEAEAAALSDEIYIASLEAKLEADTLDGETRLELQQELAEKSLELEQEDIEARLELSALSEEEKQQALLDIDETYAKKRQNLEEKAADERDKLDEQELESKKDRADSFLSAVSDVNSLITDINNARIDNELAKLDEREKVALANFKGTDEEREKIEKKFANEREEIRYKADKQAKTSSLISAGIATALAVVKALPVIPLAIAAGIAGAASIAVIASKKIPAKQTFARGGILNGPSHANGGITTNVGELEGGEAVINKAAMSNPEVRELASIANESTGGASFGTGKGINLAPESVAAIGAVINDKQTILNTNTLSDTEDEVTLIDEESTI